MAAQPEYTKHAAKSLGTIRIVPGYAQRTTLHDHNQETCNKIMIPLIAVYVINVMKPSGQEYNATNAPDKDASPYVISELNAAN